MKLLRWLVSLAIPLAMVVIVLGAYTRLTDAGLGCPDWPGCYGLMQVPGAEHVEHAAAAFPDRPLEVHKARNEMVHRYFAGSLGLLIAAIFFVSWWQHKALRKTPAFLLGLVVFQAALGMWTVTLNLFPLVVMGHLLGGFCLLTALGLYAWRLWQPQPLLANSSQSPSWIRPLAGAATLVLVLQIALGGWTSANYAAMACVDLPICHSGWTEQLNFSEAFDLHLSHQNYEYGVMGKEARQSIHISHRFGALLTLLIVGSLAFALWRHRQQTGIRKGTLLLASLLLLQFVLGVINVWWHLPLLNAVAHNFVAANLLMVLVIICYRLNRQRR